MADAQEIYRRFCAAPLRLRTKPTVSPTSSPSVHSDDSPARDQREKAAPNEPTETAVPTADEVATEAEVERLEARIEVECRVGEEPVQYAVVELEDANQVPQKRAPLRRASTRTRTPKSIAVSPPVEAAPLDKETQPKKQKRVTRAVRMVNSDTGGMCVDTPTKAAAPPKRIRKSAGQPKRQNDVVTDDGDVPMDEADKENAIVDVLSVSRNIMDAFADIDEALPDPVALEKPKKPSRKKQPTQRAPKRAPLKATVQKKVPAQVGVRRSRRIRDKGELVVHLQEPVVVGEAMLEAVPMEVIEAVKPDPVVNVESAFCEPLLTTRTTSGALFALWFSALAAEVEQCDVNVEELVEILSAFFAVCMGICQCEAMAKAQDEPSIKEDNVEGSSDASVAVKNMSTKAVRFRHFDLSSLNLRYLEDKSAVALVDELLRHYVTIIDHTTTLWDRQHHPLQAAMIARVVSILSDTDRLARQSSGSSPVAEAFRAMSEFEHSEIRACQPIFSSEFAKLSPTASAQSRFMEEMFSSLISSVARYRLRELFLPFDPRELLDEGQKIRIAHYEHQDFGAAIHRALKEIHVFEGLVGPLLAMCADTADHDEEAIKNAILAIDADDLVHVEQYILASRYLRLSFGRCILVDGAEDEETTELREQLEKLCTLAKRLRFEDEAHFFPLASVESFVKELEGQEKACIVLDKVLGTVAMPHYEMEAPCVECNEIVTRAHASEAITCCSCGGRFHLVCLHLPPSFVQFADQYTCPFCYIGRNR